MGCIGSKRVDYTMSTLPKLAPEIRESLSLDRASMPGSDQRLLSSSSSDRRELRMFREWLSNDDEFNLDSAYRVNALTYRQRMALSGVPEPIRWYVWRAVAGCSEIFKPGLYDEVRAVATKNVKWSFDNCRNPGESTFDINSMSARSQRSGDHLIEPFERLRIEEIVALVKQDLCRTFPFSDFYKNDVNLARLGNVIVSYAALNREVGYCQGMNFLAGLLLQLSDSEQETFWMLTLVMVRYNLQSLYMRDIPLLHLLKFQFEALLEEYVPRVHEHFAKLYVSPELYAVKWFFSLFAYSLPVDTVYPLWDFIFSACPPHQLHTGFWRAILLVALAIVQLLHQPLLRASSVCEVGRVFSQELCLLKPQRILAKARSLDDKVMQATLEGLRAHWAEAHTDYNDTVSRGELVALLMPSAILEWRCFKRNQSNIMQDSS